MKEEFEKFHNDNSDYKKTILASQLMLLRSELVVDKGVGILKELEDMITFSSIGKLIEKRIKEQEESCQSINGKIKPAIESAIALV